MSKMGTFIGFVVGFGCGFSIGYFVSKKRYEKKADLEIASVKEAYSSHYKSNEESKDKAPDNGDEDKQKLQIKDILSERNTYQDYLSKINEQNKQSVNHSVNNSEKNDFSTIKSNIVEEEAQSDEEPYPITPEEFTRSEYNTETLFYFSDFVLTDDDFNPVSAANTIGENGFKYFGLYEDDCAYIRNERDKTDYEILRDERKFSDIRPIRYGST